MHPFVKAVAALRFENCFNPYVDRCVTHDRHDAPLQRANALSAILERASHTQIDAIWIGRDLGYRGGRRTGLALTDDVHISRHSERWGVSTERPTTGEALKERTAAVVWNMLDQIDEHIFLWNVFPLHPHEPGNEFSNRQHNASERQAGEQLLQALIRLLNPARIIAVGNDAAAAAARISGAPPVVCVRHPSYGGQTQFLQQVAELYGIKEQSPKLL